MKGNAEGAARAASLNRTLEETCANAVLAGRYRVIRQLGQGGMGSVWLAEDEKLDGFKVAIKMLPSVLVNNKRAYAQVKAEALVSLKLSHPNIVTVRGFEEEGGNPFLVMDYIDGQTLDDYLAEKGKLTEEETVKLLKPVAAALDYAHAQGVVHRDVKPGNVMIRKDGTPFVLDFGIAREIQETMTRVTGKLSSGTLLYMSPEQLNGDAPKPAQDIYSFAAMAYECLKGEPPFSRGQIEFQILNKDPEPLLCGSALAKAILRGLAKVPETRPVNCMGVVAPVLFSRTRMLSNPPVRSIEIPDADVRFTPPRDRPKFGLPRESALAAELKRNSRKVLLVAGVLLAVGCMCAIAKLMAQNSSRRDGMAQELPRQSTMEQKILADNARAKALARMEDCRRIDKGDGFREKVEECANVLVGAQAEYDHKRWVSAAKVYDEVARQCATVVDLGKARDQAREAAVEMEKQALSAKDAEADQYAVALFNDTKDTVARARSEFAAMRFVEAAVAHNEAANLFEKATGEATKVREERQKAERAQQEQKAKEGELRKKNEREIADLREACETARRVAVEAESNKYAMDEMVTATRSFLDADKAAESDRKQAYKTALKAFEHAKQVALEAASKAPPKKQKSGSPLDVLEESKGTPRTQQTPGRSRTYAYTVRLVPYVMEGGEKKYVAVEATCGEPSVAVWSCQDLGRMIVVAGSNVRQTGLISVKFKTEDGNRSGRKWLNAEDFASDLSQREIEVELK